MKWNSQRNTLILAQQWNPFNGPHGLPRLGWKGLSFPQAQFPGFNFNISSHTHTPYINGQIFAPLINKSSPKNIISEMSARRYLTAIRLTLSWGGMSRAQKYVYSRTPSHINIQISRALSSMINSNNFLGAWNIFSGLGWTSTWISKYGHFLARAANPGDQYVPVPFDNAVSKQKLWKEFYYQAHMRKISLQSEDWTKKTYNAYECYITAICEWAKRMNTSTTDIESSIFANY